MGMRCSTFIGVKLLKSWHRMCSLWRISIFHRDWDRVCIFCSAGSNCLDTWLGIRCWSIRCIELVEWKNCMSECRHLTWYCSNNCFDTRHTCLWHSDTRHTQSCMPHITNSHWSTALCTLPSTGRSPSLVKDLYTNRNNLSIDTPCMAQYIPNTGSLPHPYTFLKDMWCCMSRYINILNCNKKDSNWNWRWNTSCTEDYKPDTDSHLPPSSQDHIVTHSSFPTSTLSAHRTYKWINLYTPGTNLHTERN